MAQDPLLHPGSLHPVDLGELLSTRELFMQLYGYERPFDLQQLAFPSYCQNYGLRHGEMLSGSRAFLRDLRRYRRSNSPTVFATGLEVIAGFDQTTEVDHSSKSQTQSLTLLGELQSAAAEARAAAAAAREAAAELHAVESRRETLAHLAGRFEGDPFWSRLEEVTQDYWLEEDAG